MKMKLLTAITFILLVSINAYAIEGFNPYILKAVKLMQNEREGGGYNMSKAFTRNLKYGDSCCIKASQPHLTMCVAAVSEIIIEALNIYAKETGDKSVFKTLPKKLWTHGTRTSLRANIFMYAGTNSRGTAHTLERFGLGKELNFEKLIPGDFINLNRSTGSGHAVVFMGYLDAKSNLTKTYTKDIIGFQYYSAQGKYSDDAGFALRNAYFGSHCPPKTKGINRDCNVIKSTSQRYLNRGRMYMPKYWTYQTSIKKFKKTLRSDLRKRYKNLKSKTMIEDMVNFSLNEELPAVFLDANYFDGVTTD
jgi:hypothetical protein